MVMLSCCVSMEALQFLSKSSERVQVIGVLLAYASLALPLKLPPLRHPVKRRMALERPYVAWKQSEADGATAVPVVDAVDQRRQFLAPAVVDREQVGLMLTSGHQVE